MSAQRIALVSDLHGNEVALRAVLDDARKTGIDAIACLGDVATLGPRPREVLQLLRDACSYFVLGNHDEYMFDRQHLAHHTQAPAVLEAIEWCQAQLSAADVAFLRTFEARRAISLDRAGTLLLFHGSPDSNEVDLLVDTPSDDLRDMFRETRAEVMAGGHTHIQMLRQHDGTLVVNPGSVGMPFRSYVNGGPPEVMPYAEYAVVEANGRSLVVSLKRVELERAALRAAAHEWGTALGGYLVTQYS